MQGSSKETRAAHNIAALMQHHPAGPRNLGTIAEYARTGQVPHRPLQRSIDQSLIKLVPEISDSSTCAEESINDDALMAYHYQTYSAFVAVLCNEQNAPAESERPAPSTTTRQQPQVAPPDTAAHACLIRPLDTSLLLRKVHGKARDVGAKANDSDDKDGRLPLVLLPVGLEGEGRVVGVAAATHALAHAAGGKALRELRQSRGPAGQEPANVRVSPQCTAVSPYKMQIMDALPVPPISPCAVPCLQKKSRQRSSPRMSQPFTGAGDCTASRADPQSTQTRTPLGPVEASCSNE